MAWYYDPRCMNLSLISMVNQTRPIDQTWVCHNWTRSNDGISKRWKNQWFLVPETQVRRCCFDRCTTFWEGPFLSWQILVLPTKKAKGFGLKKNSTLKGMTCTGRISIYNMLFEITVNSHQPYQQNTAVFWRLKFPILKYVTWQVRVAGQWKQRKFLQMNQSVETFWRSKNPENHQWSFLVPLIWVIICYLPPIREPETAIENSYINRWRRWRVPEQKDSLKKSIMAGESTVVGGHQTSWNVLMMPTHGGFDGSGFRPVDGFPSMEGIESNPVCTKWLRGRGTKTKNNTRQKFKVS